jgi:hypothetical protein
MSAFLQSGRSVTLEFAEIRVRFRPRLCKNVRDFDTNGTAHHFGVALVETKSLVPTLAWL